MRGKVEFFGANVAGVMNCKGGDFSVPKTVAASDLGAPEEYLAFDAISLTNAEIKGGLFLAGAKKSDDAKIDGSLDLKGAFARVLVDSVASWPMQPKKKRFSRHGKPEGPRNAVHLDGFTFNRFGGKAPRGAKKRMRWLGLQPKAHMGYDFRPQPFEQLIKVLKDMGHPEDVRRLAIEREKLLHRSRWALWWRPSRFFPALSAVFSTLMVGWLMGYGYRPLRVVKIMLIVGLLCGVFYDGVKDQGVFAPRDTQVLLYQQARDCAAPQDRPPSGTWSECLHNYVHEYSHFDPYAYSFNVLFPVIDLFQEKTWAPVRKEVVFAIPYFGPVKGPERMIEAVVFLELAFGSLVSILAVALFSGLIRKVRTE